jgi:hypothetical protein
MSVGEEQDVASAVVLLVAVLGEGDLPILASADASDGHDLQVERVFDNRLEVEWGGAGWNVGHSLQQRYGCDFVFNDYSAQPLVIGF